MNTERLNYGCRLVVRLERATAVVTKAAYYWFRARNGRHFVILLSGPIYDQAPVPCLVDERSIKHVFADEPITEMPIWARAA